MCEAYASNEIYWQILLTQKNQELDSDNIILLELHGQRM
jgi:hypothetical protein